MARKHRFESPALRHAFERYIGDDPEQQAAFNEELGNLEVARKLYDLRAGAGLTQAQLAKRVGTTASVISRLEDASYQGHSLTMLQRIASALDRRVELNFIPFKRRAPAPASRSGQGSLTRRATKHRGRKTA